MGICERAQIRIGLESLAHELSFASPVSHHPEQFDFFVSYARKDNEGGWITQFLTDLQEEHRKFTGGREFRFFFDQNDIQSLDDWRHSIHEKLARSRLLVAFVSPSYFASEWCRREWRAWIDIEIAKHILSDGAAPVYIVEVPWFAASMSEQQVAEEITRLSNNLADPTLAHEALDIGGQVSRRQFTQVRPFYNAGLEALRYEDLRKVLASLAKNLSDRAEHVRAAADSRSTIPPYNRRFVGRLEELTLLRERLHQGRTGVISGHQGDLPGDGNIIASVHGLGGIGKTELAFTYAHAFAGLYPGGRFLIPCDGRSDLRSAMLALDEVFHPSISDEQRKTLHLHFGAIRNCLRRRLHETGRILLVLDNVTDPALLSPEQTDVLRTLGPELHLLATTRLGAPQGGGSFDDVHWLTLGELSFEDSLRLLEKHRAFATPEEQEAAGAIARRLGGFALCVEVVGAFLGQHPEQSYAQFLETMGLEDLAPVDLAAERRDVITRRHNNEKRLRSILDHTLRDLPREAMTALHFASLLPPDHVVLPWLSKLAGAVHPALATDAPAWPQLIARLVSLALLTRGENGEAQALDESHQPRVLRCHRLLQDYLRGRSDPEEKTTWQDAVDALVMERTAVLAQITRWEESRWELGPLTALAGLWDETNHPAAAALLNIAGSSWYELAEWTHAEPLLRRSLALFEKDMGQTESDVSRAFGNLAQLLQATNRLAEAESLMRRAMAIVERRLGPAHPEFAGCLNNLALLLKVTGRLGEAKALHRQALAIHEQSYGPEHPDVGRDLNNLAALLQVTDEMEEAETLQRRALAIHEKCFGPHHPEVAKDLNNLGHLLHVTNRLAEAEPLYRRALAIDEACYGKHHPQVAVRLNNLAALLQAEGRLKEAEPLCRRALAIDETSYGPEHPEVATDLNNLAQLLRKIGRLDEAESMMRRVLAIDEAGDFPGHPEIVTHLRNFAHFLRTTNRPGEAEPLLRKAVVVSAKLTAAMDDEHPQLQSSVRVYRDLLTESGRTERGTMWLLDSALREGGLSLGG